MRIGITFLAFGKDIFAGMENALYNFAKGLQSNGDDVAIFTSRANGDETIVDTIPVFRSQFLPVDYSQGDRVIIDSLQRHKTDLQNEMKTFINQFKPDALVAWDPLWGFIQYLEVNTFSQIPTYLSLHVISDDDVLELSEQYPYSARFGVSEVFINQLHNKGYKSKIEVLPNSIEIERVQSLANNQKKFGNRPYIFCNARLSPEKGVQYAVEAFAEFHKKYPGFDLYLCDGDFPFGDKNIVKNELMPIIKEKGISDHVVFIPKLPWQDVPGIIAGSFCTVLPSLIESFGLAILESLAIGKPTITTTAGNLPALVGNAGILVEPESSTQIADALGQLVENKEYYNKLSQDAADRAVVFDSALIAKNFINRIS